MDQIYKNNQLAAFTPLGQIRGFSEGFFKTAGNQPASRFEFIVSNIITVLTIFGSIAFLLWFVIGALTWITSGSNTEQLNKAKNQMSTAFVGLFVLVLSYSIIFILGKVTGLNMLNPELIIKNLKH